MTPTTYRIAWNPSTDDRGGTVTYRVHGALQSYTDFSMCCGYVQPSTQYTETVTARDSAGNESAPATVTFTTPATDEPPTAPQNLRVVSSTSSSVTLAWDASTDLGGVAGYELYRSGILAGSVNAPTTTITLSGLIGGQTYSYTAKAWGYAQQSSLASNTIAFTPPPPTHPVYTNALYSPAMLQRGDGETNIVAVGPNNTLDFYYNAQGSPVWGSVPIAGPGNAFSRPAVLQRADGETDVVVPGPNNTLYYYFNFRGDPKWNKIAITAPGQAISGASMIQRSDGETDVTVRGPNNSLDFYYNFKGNPAWGYSQITGGNMAYFDPAMLQRPNTGETNIVVSGPNNSLDFYFNF